MNAPPAGLNPLTVDRVSKLFGETAALWDVSFSLGPGEVVALLGGNGAGKSTLLRIAAFLLKPTSGTVSIFGATKPTPEVKQRLALLGHQSFLYDDLTAEENLKFYAALHGIGPNPSERIATLLAEVGADEYSRRRVGTLSHGMRKKVSFARALLPDPDVILLDEPFSGLDVKSVGRTVRLIADLRQQGKSLVVTTHQADLLDGIADAQLILERGRTAGSEYRLQAGFSLK
jgi:heme exporter protein A